GNVSAYVDFSFTLDTQGPSLSVTSPTSGGPIAAGVHLVGTVNGTGSDVVALGYAFDGRTPRAVSFDPPGRTFEASLDLASLASGPHVLSVTAIDAAGNTHTSNLNVTLSSAIPPTVSEFSPVAGVADVGSTFRPKITFSRPINKSTLNGSNFY